MVKSLNIFYLVIRKQNKFFFFYQIAMLLSYFLYIILYIFNFSEVKIFTISILLYSNVQYLIYITKQIDLKYLKNINCD